MRKTLIRIVLIASACVALVVIVYLLRGLSGPALQPYTVTTGQLLTGVTVSGTIRCTQKTAAATELLAAVEQVPVTEGQQVSPGDVLVKLDDRVIAAECAKAQASVDLVREELAELKAGPRAEEIVKTEQAVKQAESKLNFAQAEYNKVADLLSRDVATASELDQAKNQLELAQADLKHAQAELRLLQSGARAEQIAAAEAKVRLAEAELQRCQSLRDKHTVRAGHAGVVTAKFFNPGEVVSPGQVLLEVHNLGSIEVRAAVQENELSGVKPGGAARVLADAYPDTPMDAVVDRILPRVDPESGTVTVLLRLTAPPPVTLMDGMAVDVALLRSLKEGTVVVPAAAVTGEGDRAYVHVQQGRSFKHRKVTAGASDGQWTEITSGLHQGEVVGVP